MAVAHLGGVVVEPLALHDLDILDAGPRSRSDARVGIGVHPAVLGLDAVDGFLDRPAHH